MPARVFALLNMASNDSLVASFWTKYHYKLWRPETAIFEGGQDGNAKTDTDITFKPYILAPCFPSYASKPTSFFGVINSGSVLQCGEAVAERSGLGREFRQC